MVAGGPIRTNRNAVFLNRQMVIDNIMREAKVLNLHMGAVELYADRVALAVERWANRRAAVTTKDLNLRIAKELEPYNKDLSFIYKNRGKII